MRVLLAQAASTQHGDHTRPDHRPSLTKDGNDLDCCQVEIRVLHSAVHYKFRACPRPAFLGHGLEHYLPGPSSIVAGSSMPQIRERLAHAIGLDAGGRVAIVRAMLERHARDRVGYWFQLAMSTGIATLGLVLGSGGVVIGAMLVSPLMAPLVEFGMGLAVGSPILVVRSFVRTVGSVAGVVAASAAIAWLLPYQRITAEISARTSPTLLDLFVAVFCALAAAFTTVRGSSDTVTAAAGTAIGISLVPPLCVGGYGLGTGLLEVSSGALLLFTANFTAIVLVAVLSFLLLRFDEIDVHAAEQSVLDAGLTTPRAGRWLHALLGARYGRALRIGMPLLVAVTVYFPLRRALIEVSWKIRVQSKCTRCSARSRTRNRRSGRPLPWSTVALPFG